jgi:hypothetical protein
MLPNFLDFTVGQDFPMSAIPAQFGAFAQLGEMLSSIPSALVKFKANKIKYIRIYKDLFLWYSGRSKAAMPTKDGGYSAFTISGNTFTSGSEGEHRSTTSGNERRISIFLPGAPESGKFLSDLKQIVPVTTGKPAGRNY